MLILRPYDIPNAYRATEGIVFVERLAHRRQRRIVVSLLHSACAQDRLIRIVQNPLFGAAHMKLLCPVFLDKAYKVRPLLAAVSIVPNSKECTP